MKRRNLPDHPEQRPAFDHLAEDLHKIEFFVDQLCAARAREAEAVLRARRPDETIH